MMRLRLCSAESVVCHQTLISFASSTCTCVQLYVDVRDAYTTHSEIKAQYLFEKETAEIKYPDLQDGSFSSNFKLGLYEYTSLLTSRSTFTLHPT